MSDSELSAEVIDLIISVLSQKKYDVTPTKPVEVLIYNHHLSHDELSEHQKILQMAIVGTLAEKLNRQVIVKCLCRHMSYYHLPGCKKAKVVESRLRAGFIIPILLNNNRELSVMPQVA